MAGDVTESDYAAVVRRCAQHVLMWGGRIGVTPDTLAANVHDFRILGDSDRLRVAVLLTKLPTLAVTTEGGVRWYRKDMAPEQAWSAAA